MKFCYICKSKDPSLSYHRFPKDRNSRKQWLDSLNLQEDDIFKSTQVCSQHFREDCFSTTIGGRASLSKNAVPTMSLKIRGLKNVGQTISTKFLCNSIDSPNSIPTKSSSHETTSFMINESTWPSMPSPSPSLGTPTNRQTTICSPKNAHKYYEINSLNVTTTSCPLSKTPPFGTPRKRQKTFNSPKSARRRYDNAIQKIHVLKTKLLCVRKENYKLKKKVKSLEDLVTHLKRKNLLSNNAEEALLASDAMKAIWKKKL